MDAWVAFAAVLAGLASLAASALAPVRVSVRWRGGVRTAGHLAVQAQLRYLFLRVRARGAVLARLPSPTSVAARFRLILALGPLRLATRTLAGPSSLPRPPFGRRRAGADRPWKATAAAGLVRRLRGRLVATRLALSMRLGARDAMAAALGAASAHALIACLAARLMSFLAPASPRPRVVVRPAFGQTAIEARGELVAQVRAWVVVLAVAGAAVAAARAALRGTASPDDPQRASAHSAAA